MLCLLKFFVFFFMRFIRKKLSIALVTNLPIIFITKNTHIFFKKTIASIYNKAQPLFLKFQIINYIYVAKIKK